jgi:all-trans-retinol 13,14-reductase
MNYDIIIIGAGLGGLTAGARLAKEGKKVLIVEQHDRPGGCATTFKRKGFTFEVGLHEMDGLSGVDMKMKIFRELGVFDNVEFLRVPEFYHFVNKNVELTIPHDPQEAAEVLTNAFPNEKEGIEAYFDQIINVKKKIKAGGQENMTIGEFLDTIIKDEDLKLALLGNLGYFHDDPYSLSLIYYSLAQNRYYGGGGNFIKGGSQKLSDYLAKYISENGGEVKLNHIATSILTEGDKALGIKYLSLRGKKEEYTAYAEEIIANASVPHVAHNLLPAEEGAKLAFQTDKLELGASLLTIYFGFNRKLKDIGSKYYSTFVFDDTIKTQADIKNNNAADFKERSYTFVDYSQVDSALCPEDKSVGVICCIDYASDWESLSDEVYKAKKEEVAQIYIDKLEKLIPVQRIA